MWKGDSVGYNGIHGWTKRHLEKPETCQDCGEERRLDLANISQKYLRDVSDWEWLCRRCHMKKDGRVERLLSGNRAGGQRNILFSQHPEYIDLFSRIAKKRGRDEFGRFLKNEATGWGRYPYKEGSFKTARNE